MKLFVEEKVKGKKTGQKRYLDKIAPTKKELVDFLGSKEFFINNEKYFVAQVQAEKSSDNTALGMVIGGVLGVVGGAIGIAAGGMIGGALGRDSDIKENEKVNMFNRSRL